jgi:hypothetical protein
MDARFREKDPVEIRNPQRRAKCGGGGGQRGVTWGADRSAGWT